MDADRIAEQVGEGSARPSSALWTWVDGWEKNVLTPYDDGFGNWTVGRGHVMQATDPRVPITQAESDELLTNDLAYYCDGVLRLIPTPALSQCQLDALTAFAMNCGLGNLAGSTLRKRVLGGYMDQAALEFARWNIATGANGVRGPVVGLTKRRAAERAIFEKCDYSRRP